MQGINKGLEDSQKIKRQWREQELHDQQMKLMEEQRKLLEEQRRALEEEKQTRGNREQNQTPSYVAPPPKPTDYKTCINYLDNNVPDWRQIKTDPAFINWLNVQVPGTPYTRRDYLKSFLLQDYCPYAARYFNDYKATLSGASGNSCADNCRDMYYAKKLKQGISINECVRRLCN